MISKCPTCGSRIAQCERCGDKWTPKKENPKRCAKCLNKYWTIKKRTTKRGRPAKAPPPPGYVNIGKKGHPQWVEGGVL